MRVLAIEDEPEYLEMLQEVMKSLGHTIVIATSGEQGLRMATVEKADVVISDVKMPGMDGIELHDRIRALPGYGTTPFIFLTGLSDVSAVKAACSTPGDLLIQKPFPVDRLLSLFSGSLK
jgi:two-component system CheB/CheR fusion protein